MLTDAADDDAVAVIITARNAAETVGLAVASALAQRRVTEVVVIDDGSTDVTAAAALGVDDGSGRLRVIGLERNRGPSHGRNVAIAATTAPLIAILDADDFMGPDRLERLVTAFGREWDLIADDIQFTTGPDAALAYDRLLPPGTRLPLDLTLAAFARGNLRRHVRHRRELGFLKPVIRRSFLETHALAYDEQLRLGEDFVLVTRCLLAGARFRLVEACGYFAVQSPASLSGSHATDDIGALHKALTETLDGAPLASRPRDLIAVERAVGRNHDIRRALDAKRNGGWPGLLAHLGRSPTRALALLASLAEAKLRQRTTDSLHSPSSETSQSGHIVDPRDAPNSHELERFGKPLP